MGAVLVRLGLRPVSRALACGPLPPSPHSRQAAGVTPASVSLAMKWHCSSLLSSREKREACKGSGGAASTTTHPSLSPKQITKEKNPSHSKWTACLQLQPGSDKGLHTLWGLLGLRVISGGCFCMFPDEGPARHHPPGAQATGLCPSGIDWPRTSPPHLPPAG